MSNRTTADYVVGDDDCKVTDILRLIICTNISLTYPHLFMLMVFFQTQKQTISEIEHCLSQSTPSEVCLKKILIEWRSRMSSRARLSTFVEYLRNCNLNTLADVLQNKFWPGSTFIDSVESKPSEEHLLRNKNNYPVPAFHSNTPVELHCNKTSSQLRQFKIRTKLDGKPAKSTKDEKVLMTEILVGCQINKILDICLMCDDAHEQLKTNLSVLMLCLDTPYRFKDDIKRLTLTIYESFEMVLTEWVQRKPHEANLHTLIQHLRECRINFLAEKLESHFCNQHTQESKATVLTDKQSACSFATFKNVDEGQSFYTYNHRGEPLLQRDDTAKYLVDNYVDVVLTLLETPPTLSTENIMELMRRLRTPISERQYILGMLRNRFNHQGDVIEHIIMEWLCRDSRNATLNCLILELRKCNLNSHADALKERFQDWLSSDKDMLKVNLTSQLKPNYDVRSNNSESLLPIPTKAINRTGNGDSYRRVRSYVHKSALICVLALTIAIFFIIFYMKDLDTYNESITVTTTSSSVTRLLDTSSEDIPQYDFPVNSYKICSESEIKRSIVVESYDQIIKEVSNFSNCDPVSVQIISSDSNQWSSRLDLLKEYNIVSLSIEGSINIETTFEIIKQLVQIKHLHVNNTSNNIHPSSMPFSECHYKLFSDCNIELFRLQTLRLSSFGQCEEILEMVLTCVKTNLKLFEFYGRITDESAYQIFHLIQANRRTLREITVVGIFETNLNIIPFDKQMNSLQVLNIKVLNRSSTKRKDILSETFCSLVPELDIIKVGLPVELQQLFILQNCLKIRTLEIVVDIDVPFTANDVINSIENFRQLSSLVIFVNFQNGCPNSKTLQDIHTKFFSMKIHYLQLCSNCKFLEHERASCMLVHH